MKDDREEMLINAAQMCSNFSRMAIKNNHLSKYSEEISCELCINWDGETCLLNSYNDVLINNEQY